MIQVIIIIILLALCFKADKNKQKEELKEHEEAMKKIFGEDYKC